VTKSYPLEPDGTVQTTAEDSPSRLSNIEDDDIERYAGEGELSRRGHLPMPARFR